jgi:hypothetical protein
MRKKRKIQSSDTPKKISYVVPTTEVETIEEQQFIATSATVQDYGHNENWEGN